MYISPALINKYRKPAAQKSELDEIQHLIDLKQTRIEDAGGVVPEPSAGLGSKLLQALFMIDRPRNAIASAIDEAQWGGSPWEGFTQGLSGKRQVWGSDLLDNFGVDNPVAREVGGFVLDIGIDPLTWFGGILGSGAAKGLRLVGAPEKLAKVAERGVVSEIIAPTAREFNKGLLSHGLKHLTVEDPVVGLRTLPADTGQGFAGALGRFVGGIGTEEYNLGKAATKFHDTVGSLLNTRFVKHSFDPYGVPGRTHAEAKDFLLTAQDDVRDIAREMNYLFKKSVKELEDSPLTGLTKAQQRALVRLKEQPIYYVRKVIRDAKELPRNIRPYTVQEAKLAHKILTSPEEVGRAIDESIARLKAEVTNPILSSEDFVKAQKKLTSLEKTKALVEEAFLSVDTELKRFVKAGVMEETALREALNYWVERDKWLMAREGLSPSQALPVYLYHCLDNTAEEVQKIVSRYPELARQLSLGISPHKKRHVATLEDFDVIARKIENKNKELLLHEIGKVTTKDTIEQLRKRNLSFEELKKFAKDRGVPVHTIDFDPVPKVVKDPFAIQVMRELESARYVARKNFIDKYAGKTIVGEGLELDVATGTLIRNLNDDPNLLKHGWIKTDMIVGFPKGSVIHPELYRAIKQLDNVLTNDAELKGFLHNVNKIQNMWKISVTSGRPMWYVTNISGNVFNCYLAGLKNPSRYAEAALVQAGANIDNVLARLGIKSTVADRAMTTDELRDLIERHGLQGYGEVYGDVARSPIEMIRKLTGQATPAKTVGGKARKAGEKAVDSVRMVGDAIETNAKIALFIDRLSKGDTVEQAAQTVRKYLFDYTDITKTERMAKLIAPFYTFTRKNLPLQLKSLLERPDKYLAIMRARETSYRMFGVSDEEKENMPDWFRDRAFATPIDNVFFTPMLPYDTLADFMESPTRAALNMVSPLLKVPAIEMPLNISTFTGQPIERYEGQRANFLGVDMSATQAYLLSQIGTGRELNKASRLVEAGKEYKGTTSPIKFDNDIATILSSLALPAMHYNPEKAKLYNAYEYDKRLEDAIKALKDLGIPVRTYTEIQKDARRGGRY